MMKGKQILLSFIPILGSVFYSFYLFIKDRQRFKKSALSMIVGMLTFAIIYGCFAIICNAAAINLTHDLWLVYVLLYISGFLWNCMFFVTLNRW